MNTQTINFIAAVLASAGLFFIVGSQTGVLKKLSLKHRVTLALDDEPSVLEYPLAARLAKALAAALPFHKDQPSVELRISQAGTLFDNPAQFYQRKFAYMVLLFTLAFGVSILFKLSLPASILVSTGVGILGLYGPDSELNERIKKRRNELRREMSFMLDRVAFAVMAYGTFQEALARMNRIDESASKERRMGTSIPEQRPETAVKRLRMASLGSTVTGMGGGLFAEYLNRMASLLLGSATERFSHIRRQLDTHYPTSAEIQNFLDIVEAGLRGAPMADRLLELADAMILEMEQEQREAGTRATSVVVLAAGAVLVPLLLVVGGPAFFLAISVFGG